MSRLHRYCRLGDVDAVAACLADGDDVNQVGVRARLPLTDAAQAGHVDVVRLLDAGADLRGAGGTALHLAAMHGHPDVVALLLERGADVNATSPDSRTPILCAALWNRAEVVAYLRDHGADMTARDRDGRTADEWLAEGGVFGRNPDATADPTVPRLAKEDMHASVRRLMAGYPTADEYAARHGRLTYVWSYGAYRYEDPDVQAWAARVAEVLFTPGLLDEVEERHLQGDELEEARKCRVRRERRRRQLEADRQPGC